MKNNKGFTLTELLAVILILGLLVAIAIPVYINISRRVNENEYLSKKKYIESVAVKYAEETGTIGTITAGRLVSTGYLEADKYVIDETTNIKIPWIINPKNKNDNLACRSILITVDQQTKQYYANMSDEESNSCDLLIKEQSYAEMGIHSYKYDSKTEINYNPITQDLDWSNEDVIIFVQKDDNINQVLFDGRIQGGEWLTNINEFDSKKEYKNAKLISTYPEDSIKVIVENDYNDNTVKQAIINVNIDKKGPDILVDSLNGWVSQKSEVFIYMSDRNGSGVQKLYYSKNKNADVSSRESSQVVEGATYAKISGVQKDEKYYLWAEDKVGNISTDPTEYVAKNIDPEPPTINDFRYDNQLVKIVAKVTDKDSGTNRVQYCVTDGDDCEVNDINKRFEYDNVNNQYVLKWPQEKDKYRICIKAFDNVDNDTEKRCETFDVGLRITEVGYENGFEVKFKKRASGKGMTNYKCTAVNVENPSEIASVQNTVSGDAMFSRDIFHTCDFSKSTVKPKTGKEYKVTIKAWNNEVGEQFGDEVSFNKKFLLTIKDAYTACDPGSYYGDRKLCSKSQILRYDSNNHSSIQDYEDFVIYSSSKRYGYDDPLTYVKAMEIHPKYDISLIQTANCNKSKSCRYYLNLLANYKWDAWEFRIDGPNYGRLYIENPVYNNGNYKIGDSYDDQGNTLELTLSKDFSGIYGNHLQYDYKDILMFSHTVKERYNTALPSNRTDVTVQANWNIDVYNGEENTNRLKYSSYKANKSNRNWEFSYGGSTINNPTGNKLNDMIKLDIDLGNDVESTGYGDSSSRYCKPSSGIAWKDYNVMEKDVSISCAYRNKIYLDRIYSFPPTILKSSTDDKKGYKYTDKDGNEHIFRLRCYAQKADEYGRWPDSNKSYRFYTNDGQRLIEPTNNIFKEGESYYVWCQKEADDTALERSNIYLVKVEDRPENYSVINYESDGDDYTEPDIDEGENDDSDAFETHHSNYGFLSTDDATNYTRFPFIGYSFSIDTSDSYGLITQDEYELIENILNPLNNGKGVRTVLATLLKGRYYNMYDYRRVVKRSGFYGSYQRRSDFTQVVGYYSTRWNENRYGMYAPMYYGRQPGAMALSFNPNVKLSSGFGTESDPYVVPSQNSIYWSPEDIDFNKNQIDELNERLKPLREN